MVAVQLSGRESLLFDPAHETVESMVASVSSVLVGDATPFAFYGHSMGALIGYELALMLEASARPSPTHLFVSSRRPPDVAPYDNGIHELPDAEFIDVLRERYGGLPDEILREPDLLQLVLPTIRADLRALEAYVPVPDRRTRCPIIAYGGVNDHRPTPDELRGWERMSSQPLRVQLYDGGHFFLAEQRRAPERRRAHARPGLTERASRTRLRGLVRRDPDCPCSTRARSVAAPGCTSQ